MLDQCTKLRITETGGFAGLTPRPPLVDLARSGLDGTQSQGMDEACRQLLALAGAAPGAAPPSPPVGTDIHGYLVEIEAKNGETRTFTIPHRGRRGVALEGADLGAIIKRLQSFSPPAR